MSCTKKGTVCIFKSLQITRDGLDLKTEKGKCILNYI